jgi:hypothetical protein
MMSSARCLARVILFACFLLPLTETASADEDKLLAPVLEHMARVEAAIPKWESAANRYQTLSAMVFALGLVTLALQLWTRPWTKAVVAAVGVAVSGLTGWLEKGFPADHRAHRAAVLEAQDALKNLRMQVEVYRADPDLEDATVKARLEFIKANIEPLATKLSGLEKTLVASAAPNWLPPPLRTEVAFAHAADYGAGLSAQGAGECSSLWQARENSTQAALERLATLVGQRLKRDTSTVERALLREYVAAFASRRQEQGKASGAGLYRVQTSLTLAPTYASAYAVEASLEDDKARAGPQAAAEETIRSIRKRFATAGSSPEVDGFLEASASLPPGPASMTLKAKDPRNGFFRFGLRVTATRGGARVAIESVEIHQDASGGSTRWSFDVLDGKGNRVLSIPTQRWDDSGRPTRCSLDPNAGYEGSVALVGGKVEIAIVGLKPKVR